MAEDSKRLSMADEGASFTYAAPKDTTPLETGPFMVPAPDRARVIGTESLADEFRRSGGGERKFTRSEVLTVLRAKRAEAKACSAVQSAGGLLAELVGIFENME